MCLYEVVAAWGSPLHNRAPRQISAFCPPLMFSLHIPVILQRPLLPPHPRSEPKHFNQQFSTLIISEVKNVDMDLKKTHRFVHSDSTVVIQRGTKLVARPHISQPPFLLSSGALLWSGHVPMVSIVSCSYNNKGMDKLQTLSLTPTPSHNIRVLASWINPPLNTDTEFHWAVHSKSGLCFTKESRFLF